MKKVIEFFKNDHIQASTVSGLCIIILALFFKKVVHQDIPYLENALPGFAFALFEAAHVKAKNPFWRRALPWNIIMLALTGLIILKHLL